MAKILIVDDSETLRVQLKNLLSSKGHTVVEGADGVRGLEMVKKNPDVSLIICDLNMPNMDGVTMCLKISEDATLNKIPIFMLTTEASNELKEKGKKAGVRAWINKPFDEVKLIAVIDKLFAK